MYKLSIDSISFVGANKEFYYEYKEEKNPAGTYDRKDLHTVEVLNL